MANDVDMCDVCAGSGKLLTGESCGICKGSGEGWQEKAGLRAELARMQLGIERANRAFGCLDALMQAGRENDTAEIRNLTGHLRDEFKRLLGHRVVPGPGKDIRG